MFLFPDTDVYRMAVSMTTPVAASPVTSQLSGGVGASGDSSSSAAAAASLPSSSSATAGGSERPVRNGYRVASLVDIMSATLAAAAEKERVTAAAAAAKAAEKEARKMARAEAAAAAAAAAAEEDGQQADGDDSSSSSDSDSDSLGSDSSSDSDDDSVIESESEALRKKKKTEKGAAGDHEATSASGAADSASSSAGKKRKRKEEGEEGRTSGKATPSAHAAGDGRSSPTAAAASSATSVAAAVPLSDVPPYKAGTLMTRGDWSRLWPTEWLNDSNIDWWLDLMYLRQLPSRADRARFHILTTFFYRKLTQGKRAPNTALGQVDRYDAGHMQVARWTKGVDIFAKNYVISPINMAAHWSVAIMANLRSLDSFLRWKDAQIRAARGRPQLVRDKDGVAIAPVPAAPATAAASVEPPSSSSAAAAAASVPAATPPAGPSAAAAGEIAAGPSDASGCAATAAPASGVDAAAAATRAVAEPAGGDDDVTMTDAAGTASSSADLPTQEVDGADDVRAAGSGSGDVSNDMEAEGGDVIPTAPVTRNNDDVEMTDVQTAETGGAATSAATASASAAAVARLSAVTTATAAPPSSSSASSGGAKRPSYTSQTARDTTLSDDSDSEGEGQGEAEPAAKKKARTGDAAASAAVADSAASSDVELVEGHDKPASLSSSSAAARDSRLEMRYHLRPRVVSGFHLRAHAGRRPPAALHCVPGLSQDAQPARHLP